MSADWNNWILQKNAEFTLDKLGLSKEEYIDYLEKKVREPAVGSENLYESGPNDEGSAKGAKWQGSDPRHDEDGGRFAGRTSTRKGGKVSRPAYGERGKGRANRAATSGTSEFGHQRLDPYSEKKVTLKDPMTRYNFDNN